MTSEPSVPTIAWINGEWGQPEDLTLPVSDRGLQLADGLFETVLIQNNSPCLLGAHLDRWNRSAALLGMASPPQGPWLIDLIQEAIERSGLNDSDGALRLNWSRGNGIKRGLDLDPKPPDPSQHRFWLTLQSHTPMFGVIQTWISRHERRHGSSVMSRCKTFAYGQSVQVRREAQQRGADDGLMLSTNGALCCGSSANLVIGRHGEWLTPPVSDGCLPGVMRAELLQRGVIQEQSLSPQPLPDDQWLLINSLSCRTISHVNGTSLQVSEGGEALWRSLLVPQPEPSLPS